MLNVTLAQINPTIGDMEGNIALMREAARKARDEGAQLVVFPELSLTGYYPGDLLDEQPFVERLNAGLQALLLASREIPQLHWVVGAPTRNEGVGKAFHNSLLVLKDGQVVLNYRKQLLPTYGIFDERRHFEPGPDTAALLRVGDARVGFLICEDGWNDTGRDYAVNPFERMAQAQPDLVVSINASPSHLGKREQRHEVFASACARHKLPLVYVNQIGGHDQLVYDGASFAVDSRGAVVFEAQRFVSDVTTLQFRPNAAQEFLGLDGQPLPAVDPAGLAPMEFYRQQILLGLRDYARRCGFTQVVVGSSGGIDSALTIALAAQAFGPENVTAITMPSRYSSDGSISDSAALCRNLGVELLTHPIGFLVEAYQGEFSRATGSPLKGLALENLQARIRGTTLMAYSNTFGHLLLTTGNKSEISVGYCTLYGDTSGGLGLIGDLYKTEVFELSRHINAQAGRELIPVAIIEKEPSAELAPDQKDSDSLPPYPVLDAILKVLIEDGRLAGWERDAANQVVQDLKGSAEGRALLHKVRMLVSRSEYKRRQAPPLLRLRARAFGTGRQVPIAAVHY